MLKDVVEKTRLLYYWTLDIRFILLIFIIQ